MPSVFVGVVSHAGSRYPQSQGDRGLGAQLATRLTELGVPSRLVIDINDRWQSAVDNLSPSQVQDALTAQLRIEDEWVEFLNMGKKRTAQQIIASVLRHTRRQLRYIVRPNSQFMIRLLNIELAHRALLRQGIDTGADWIIILEDDAETSDVGDLSSGLAALLAAVPWSVQFINLSESFGLNKLGVESLLHPSFLRWQGKDERSVLSTHLPITNTVCAIAYRSEFANTLVDRLMSDPIHPVIPIDWKLNRVLLNLTEEGRLGADSTLWIVPGPINQLSMRDQ